MPKIADIQETPNPNAVKFILREAISHGTSHSFKSLEDANSDKLAKSIFEVGDVVSIFYMDKMITIEKTNESDWDEVLPLLAVPIREAKPAQNKNKGVDKLRENIETASNSDSKITRINELLDEKIRPYLASDGGWIELVSLKDTILKIHYQGACGSCPSSLTGTLMAIERMINDEIDPEIEVEVI